uniref:DNA topoisomerase n=1 Tax=Rhizophora mucronata TaxID=61149 RepID=A0A2P2MBT8_RHIMU
MAPLTFHSMVSHSGHYALALLRPCFRPGNFTSSTFNSGEVLNYWPLRASLARSSLDYGDITKRHFSQVLGGSEEDKSLGGFSNRGKKEKKKKAKPSAASCAENGVTDSSTSSASNKKVEHVTNSNINSKGNATEKKQSKSKKGAEQSSSTGTSQSKKCIASKSGQSPKKEKTSTGNVINEMSDDSASTTTQSNKRSGGSSKKGKSGTAQKMGQLENVGQGKLKQLYPPSGKSVVVVESVTKAKVIQGYLGDMFEVLPSYGHVRDLAARSGSVRPDDDFSMVWEVPAPAWTHLKSIKVALSGAENLILASDPDREGEAIAWHIIEMLKQQDALHQDIIVARVVFHEITESSIKSALQAPRKIDVNLVHAYLARRALDYLIGFNISPLLWRKLPGCQSAGRVQSAALSLICDREMEIDDFKPQEYWTIEAELSRKESGYAVNANLTHVDSRKLNQLSISSHTEAKDIQKKIESINFQVVDIKKSKVRKNAPTPYITSTLQQDAANKLHFSSTYTMKLAQKLYEGIQLTDGKATGLITYHRTDGLHVSDEAVQAIRTMVIERYGLDFASSGVRKFFKKVKNAQEAHEAIRPTNIRVLPSMMVEVLDEDSLKLYTLIWSRTVACQMEPATNEQIVVEIGDASKSLVFRSACSRVNFLGYQAVYEDVEAGAVRSKENEAYDRQKSFEVLKSLKLGEPLNLGEAELKQHFTQPPSRYSEGTLVKKLEELGIGRPSTYASTLKVLQVTAQMVPFRLKLISTVSFRL